MSMAQSFFRRLTYSTHIPRLKQSVLLKRMREAIRALHMICSCNRLFGAIHSSCLPSAVETEAGFFDAFTASVDMNCTRNIPGRTLEH